mmetsp:Transcript_28599/g.46025  ORF Transcript_28599/g.46025 Transcript_28599/m.46025 type:complete len:117 (+) Transcript_28599:32-382(+)|eukprot:CAMPEP_0169062432 /NCGR_PEP_ID=MMETSP1015-20121227/682_1 /TAXON_ID=342587 /ORGANISM="Karlodinium micrum, Strain CCMP2283" /LENGTH=116 /DNA_ID=CAMNT_0009120569 /DNA_START=35 /DNA_END=385 /DNA_ORIENTATION=+
MPAWAVVLRPDRLARVVVAALLAFVLPCFGSAEILHQTPFEVQQTIGSALGDAQSAAAYAAEKVEVLTNYIKDGPLLKKYKADSVKVLDQALVGRAFLKAAKANNANLKRAVFGHD